MKKKQYKSETIYKGKYFIDYLPKEVFNKLNKEDRENYREYRRYSTLIKESQLRIEKYEKEILKLKDEISTERLKIGGDETSHDWLMKMKNRFDTLGHLNKNFVFSCSVTKRNRKSKSLKLKSGDKIVSETEIGVLKNKYKGEELKTVELWYSRIINSGKTIHKTIYLGKIESVKRFLSEIDEDGNDWSNDDIEDVRSEMKVIISQYVRHTVFHKTWKPFERGGLTLNLESISKWCNNGVELEQVRKEIDSCTTVEGLRHIYSKYLNLKDQILEDIMTQKANIEEVQSQIVPNSEIIEQYKPTENGTESTTS